MVGVDILRDSTKWIAFISDANFVRSPSWHYSVNAADQRGGGGIGCIQTDRSNADRKQVLFIQSMRGQQDYDRSCNG